MPIARSRHSAAGSVVAGALLIGVLTGATWLAVGTASAADAPSATPSTAPATPDITPPTSTVTVTHTVSATTTVTTTGTVTTSVSVSVSVTAPGSTHTTATTAAPVTATVTRAPSESSGGSSLPAILIALVVLALAAAGLAYYLAHRKPDRAHVNASDWDAALARTTSRAQWINGQAGQLGHPAMSRTEGGRRWAEASAMSADLERGLSDAAHRAPDPSRAARAAALAQALTALRGAVDAQLRVEAGPDDGSRERVQRLHDAAAEVAQRRAHLDDLLHAPPPVRPGAAPS
jgi:hypothetical protein